MGRAEGLVGEGLAGAVRDGAGETHAASLARSAYTHVFIRL
jgi:hypothetical protein